MSNKGRIQLTITGTFPLPFDVYTEMVRWCDLNSNGFWMIDPFNNIVRFDNFVDAELFTLRWL